MSRKIVPQTIGYIKFGKQYNLDVSNDCRGVDTEAVAFKSIIKHACVSYNYSFIELQDYYQKQEDLTNEIEKAGHLDTLFILCGVSTNKEYNQYLKFIIETCCSPSCNIYYIQIDPYLYFDLDAVFSEGTSYQLDDLLNRITIFGNSGVEHPLCKNKNNYLRMKAISYYTDLVDYVTSVAGEKTKKLYSRDNKLTGYAELPLSCYKYVNDPSQLDGHLYDGKKLCDYADLSYIGGTRGGSRNEIIKKYYFNPKQKEGIPPVKVNIYGNLTPEDFGLSESSPELKDVNFCGPLPVWKIQDAMLMSLATILIGDDLYNKMNIIAPRFNEAIDPGAGCISLISEELYSKKLRDDLLSILKFYGYENKSFTWEEYLDFIKVSSINDFVNSDLNSDEEFIGGDDPNSSFNWGRPNYDRVAYGIGQYQMIISNYLSTYQLNVLLDSFEHFVLNF